MNNNVTPNQRSNSTKADSPGQSALEVRSAEVQEIIGRPPHWLVRGGIGAFLGVLLLVFAAASTIEYPEVIEANVTLYRQSGDAGWYGELAIPETGLGKVEEGQPVLVHFTGYPSQQFGSVEAALEEPRELTIEEGVFQARISFPDDLSTNYGQEITPIEGMTGRAEIITKDQKLLDRIYNNIAGKLK